MELDEVVEPEHALDVGGDGARDARRRQGRKDLAAARQPVALEADVERPVENRCRRAHGDHDVVRADRPGMEAVRA